MNIDKTIQDVEKVLSTPTYPDVSSATLVRENLSPIIESIVDRETPIRDRLPRKPGSGLAASWNLITSKGVGNAPFAEGDKPNGDDTGYARRSAIYKELGKTKSITDKMLAAGKSFSDLNAQETEIGIRETIEDEEQFIITGDSGADAKQFDGLGVYITTNTFDDDNNALGFRSKLIEDAVGTIVRGYAVRPTAIYVSYGMAVAINQSLTGDVRINLDQTNAVTAGLEIKFIQTIAGKLPVIPTFAIADDATTYAGSNNVVGDIYIVTEKHRGHDIIFLEDLYPLGKMMLARTGSAQEFMVTESTVLVCRAEEFQYKIKNIRIS